MTRPIQAAGLLAITLAAAHVALAQNDAIVLLDHPQGGVVTADFEQSTVSSSPYQYKPAQHWVARADGKWASLADPQRCLAFHNDSLTLLPCADPQVFARVDAKGRAVKSARGVQPTPFAERIKPALDTNNRAAVVAAYYNQFFIRDFPLSGWTGSLANCVPGTISDTFRNLTGQVVNYYRDMAGVSVIPNDPPSNIPAQAGALIIAASSAANFRFDNAHLPPPNAPCFTQVGFEGTSTSNIWTSMRGGPDNIMGMINDAIVFSAPDVGHRTLVLDPRLTGFGTGDAVYPTEISGRTTNTLFKGAGNNTAARPRDPYVAWPPPGFVPFPVLPGRWSINVLTPNTDVSAATVTMRRADGTAVALERTLAENNGGRFGTGIIVWTVNDRGFTGNLVSGAPPPKTDVPVDVTIENIRVNGQPQTIRYRVIAIDANYPASDILLTRIPAGDLAAGATVGTLSAYKSPRSFIDTAYTFSLVDGAGSNDNASFTINGNNLVARAALAFGGRGRYSIRVRVDDGRENGVFEKALTILPAAGRPGALTAGLRLADGQAANGAAGSNVNYTASVTNNSAYPVRNVAVTTTIPTGFAVSAADTNGWQPNRAYRYARLVVDASALPRAADQLRVAELGLLDADGKDIDRRPWSLSTPAGQRDFSIAEVIDGNPYTSWQAGGALGAPTKHPYEITIDLSQPTVITGFTALNGGQAYDGWIGAYRFFLSNDRQNWGDPVAQGILPTVESLHTIRFTPRNAAGQVSYTFPGPIAPGATVTRNLTLTAGQTAGEFVARLAVGMVVDESGDLVVNGNAAGMTATASFTVGAAAAGGGGTGGGGTGGGGTGGGAPGVAPNRQAWAVDAQDNIFRLVNGQWTQVGGALIHVSIGNDLTMMGVNRGNNVFRWNGTGWDQIDGSLKQITVRNAREAWGVNANGDAYFWNGQAWAYNSADWTQLSVAADGALWGTDPANLVWNRSADGGWRVVPGSLKQVSAGSATNVWGVNANNDVFRLRDANAGAWDQMPGKLKQISVTADGEVWGITPTDDLVRWNGAGWDPLNRKFVQICAGPVAP